MMLATLGLVLFSLGNAQFSDDLVAPENLMAAGGPTVLKWNYTVNYKIQATEPLGIIKSAVKWFNSNTCLKFVEAAGTMKGPYMLFIMDYKGEKSKECFSDYGYKPSHGVAQKVYLNCARNTEDAIREISHRLGLSYEHNREDRNEYVNVFPFDSSDPSAFEKRSFATPPLKYDYGSVMHFSSMYKAKTNKTIIPKSARYSETIGTHRIQGFDIYGINRYYQCKNKNCKNAAKPACQNGGEIHAKDCTRCACPPMFRGKFCEELHPGINPFNGVSCSEKITVLWSETFALYMKTVAASYFPAQSECYFALQSRNSNPIRLYLNWYYNPVPMYKDYCDSGVQIYLNGEYGSNPITFCTDAQIDRLNIRNLVSNSTIVIRMFRGHDQKSADAVLGIVAEQL